MTETNARQAALAAGQRPRLAGAPRAATRRGLAGASGTLAALADQLLISGGNFLMVVFIGRMLGSEALGLYGLLFTALLFAGSAQDAVLSTSFALRRPELDAEQRRRYAGSCLILALGFAALCMGSVVLLLSSSVGEAPAGARGAVGLLVPAFLLRELLRRHDLASQRPGRALSLDLLSSAVQFGALGVALLGGAPTLPGFILAMAGGNAAAAALGLPQRRGEFAFSWVSLKGVLRDVVRLSRWVLAALLLLVFGMQMMPWLVALQLGTATAGVYVACASLANVAQPVMTGFINVMMPAAASAAAAGGASAVMAALRESVPVLGLLTAFVAVGTALFAGEALALAFGPQYQGQEPLLLALAGTFLARWLGAGATVGCWALCHPERNALVNLVIILVAAGGAFALMPRIGVVGAAAAGLAAELVGTTMRWLLLRRLASRLDPAR